MATEFTQNGGEFVAMSRVQSGPGAEALGVDADGMIPPNKYYRGSPSF
jgi:hypothetical protein